MPETAAADRMTIALEELTKAIRNMKEQIPFTDHSINKAIEALTQLLPPNRPSVTQKKTAEAPRGGSIHQRYAVDRIQNGVATL